MTDLNVSADGPWLRQMVDRYQQPLLRYAARLMSSEDVAQDIVQETFLRLCREERSQVQGHVAEWLFTVCRRRAVDVLRKQSPERGLSEAVTESCESREPSQTMKLETQETSSQLMQMLERLPPQQQEVVRLKFQAGLSYREIAGITELSVSNVGYLLHVALRSLKQHLQSAT